TSSVPTSQAAFLLYRWNARRCLWQLEGEARPARLDVHPDAAAMQVDQLPRDGQPQPRAAAIAPPRFVGAPEALKDVLRLLGRQRCTGVRDRDADALPHPPHRQPD